MEAILRDDRVRTAARTVAISIVITITFAVLYWGVSMLTPGLSDSIASTFGFKARFANALRAMVLPLGAPVVIGTSIGAQAYNVSTGDSGWMLQDLVPFMVMFVGFIVLALSRWWGRAWYKDLSLLALYGVLAGSVVNLRLASIAVMVAPETYEPIVKQVFLTNVAVSGLVYMMGYVFVLAWEAYRGKGGTAQ